MMRFQLAVLLVAFLLSSCSPPPVSTIEQTVFAVPNSPVELRFPSGWHKNPEKHPYDLQCFSKDDSLNTGVFLYTKADVDELGGAGSILQAQIADLQSKRENFTVLEEMEKIKLPDKTLNTVVYSGEKDSLKNHYRFSLIEFAGNPDYVLVVTQVARPSHWTRDKLILDEITRSARVSPNNMKP